MIPSLFIKALEVMEWVSEMLLFHEQTIPGSICLYYIIKHLPQRGPEWGCLFLILKSNKACFHIAWVYEKMQREAQGPEGPNQLVALTVSISCHAWQIPQEADK